MQDLRQTAVTLPPAVCPGDLIGVAALSGCVDPQRLEAGVEALRQLGFRLRLASNVSYRCGMFAGTDAERLRGFHDLAADPEVAAIVFARGGHGVLRLLPDIDWALLARRPRAYVGYSDLTPFLLQVVARLRCVAFHGPMVAADLARGLTALEEQSFIGALAGDWPKGVPLSWVSPGEMRQGPLLGGCLTLLTAVLGTPFAVDFRQAILFLEDLNEAPYRFDRMLTQLRLSGSLTDLNAVIAGHLTADDSVDPEADRACDKVSEESPQAERLRQLLAEQSCHFGGSWAWGLQAGHARPNLTLPLGMWAQLDPATRSLRLGPV